MPSPGRYPSDVKRNNIHHSGRYPIHTGLHNGVITPRQPYGLDTQFTLLPQELKRLTNMNMNCQYVPSSRAGYVSHIVGKWHLGFCNKDYWPQSRGFDSHYGFLLGAQTYFDHSRDAGYDFRDGAEVAWEANGTYSTFLIQERAKKIIRYSGLRVSNTTNTLQGA